ncbi:hypothetical protein M6B38_209065 [Iris pallida]|uniref:Uncharacterized protein n=1 Tax=Iris pallida TaxID=29817 RepID=A0AAX6E4M2_IRIPA|nr:hypothetical protein M6B38_209065 [Iris pallida]
MRSRPIPIIYTSWSQNLMVDAPNYTLGRARIIQLSYYPIIRMNVHHHLSQTSVQIL